MEDDKDKIVKYMRFHSQIIIICFSALAFIIGAVFFILTIIKKEETSVPSKEEPINSSIICTKVGKDDSQNDMTIYINYDNEDHILNVTYEEKLKIKKKYTISQLKEDEHIDLFNSVNGISANIQIFNNELVKTIKYDYQTINLEQVKKELKKYLAKESMLLKATELPITFSQFKDQELKDYTCELK